MTNAGWVESLWFEIGDEVNFDIFASDPDLDIYSIVITEYQHIGNEWVLVIHNTDTLPTQQATDYHYYFLGNLIVPGPAGNYKDCLYLIDSEGNESNEICLNTLVTE